MWKRRCGGVGQEENSIRVRGGQLLRKAGGRRKEKKDIVMIEGKEEEGIACESGGKKRSRVEVVRERKSVGVGREGSVKGWMVGEDRECEALGASDQTWARKDLMGKRENMTLV